MTADKSKCNHPYEDLIPDWFPIIMSEENPAVYAMQIVNYCTHCGQPLSKKEKNKRLSSIIEYAKPFKEKIEETVRKLEVNI